MKKAKYQVAPQPKDGASWKGFLYPGMPHTDLHLHGLLHPGGHMDVLDFIAQAPDAPVVRSLVNGIHNAGIEGFTLLGGTRVESESPARAEQKDNPGASGVPWASPAQAHRTYGPEAARVQRGFCNHPPHSSEVADLPLFGFCLNRFFSQRKRPGSSLQPNTLCTDS